MMIAYLKVNTNDKKETEEKIMNKYSPDENLEKMLNQNVIITK